jgi:lipopolysaccharide heptosyltransferase II
MKPRAIKFEPKRILIVLHGSIGDVTRALPLASLLRKGFPKAFLAWSVEPASYPLLQGNPAIDRILLFDRSKWWKTFPRFLAEVRGLKFDLVLDLQRHLKSGIVGWSSGAAQRIGFHRADSKEGNWLFNNLSIDQFGERIPKLQHYLKFAEYLGLPTVPVEWSFSLSADEVRAVELILGRVRPAFAVLLVGARWKSKLWFAEQITACADALREKFSLDVVLLGSKDDQALAESASALTKNQVINLAGKTSLREAIGIIQRARLAVGPDTGLMHIAAAVETPVISLWGATDPDRTGPYGFGNLVIRGQAPCVPCYKRQCTIGRICMKSIDNNQITSMIAAALKCESRAQTRSGHLS